MSYCKVIYGCICRQATAGSKPITAKDNNINLILTGKILQSIQLQVCYAEISDYKQSRGRSVPKIKKKKKTRVSGWRWAPSALTPFTQIINLIALQGMKSPFKCDAGGTKTYLCSQHLI